MKKLTGIILALMLLLTMPFALADNQPGDQVTVTLTASHGSAVGYQLKVNYNSSVLECVSAKVSSSASYNRANTNGSVVVMSMDMSNAGTATMTFTFRIKADAPDGTYSITVSNIETLDASGNHLSPSLSGASITVKGKCKHQNVEILPAKAATCTETGLTEGKKCKDCGEIIVPQQEVAKLAHKEEIIPGKAATCTEAGLTDGKKCSVCGEILVAQQEIKALGHKEEVIPGKAATCTESGLTDGKKCSVCGEILVAQQAIKALGHKEEVIPGKAATCTESGLTDGKKCSVCGEILVAQKEIKALGHKEEVIPSKAATCTETGLTEGKKCSVCGEILVAQKEIKALGHKEEVIPGKAATCTETGLTDGKKCTVCGEITVPQKEIAKLPHQEEVIPGKDATCTDKGLTEGKKCTVCGEVTVKQEEIAALGHDWSIVHHKPGTDRVGYDTYTCRRCKTTTEKNYVKKLATDLGEIVFNAADESVAYETVQLAKKVSELSIIPVADEDGTYTLRKLAVSFDLLKTMKNRGAKTLLFVVGDNTVAIPLTALESKEISQSLTKTATGYIITVDGESVKVEIVDGDNLIDITALVKGMTLNGEEIK